jgi:hypothetical protein
MENKTTNGWAIASFVCSIVGLFFGIILSILGIVFGNKAISTINENEQGKGLAEAGKIIGWIKVGIIIFLLIIALFCIKMGALSY